MSGPTALVLPPSAPSPNGILSSSASPGVSRGAPPGGPPEALQGAPPGASLFQSALATHWARTATAEGHQSNSSQAGHGTGSRAHEDTHNAGASAASVGVAAASRQTAGTVASDGAGGTVDSAPGSVELPIPTSTTSASSCTDALAAVGESGSAAAATAAAGESGSAIVSVAAALTLSRQSSAGVDSPGFSPVPEASVPGGGSSRAVSLRGPSGATTLVSGASDNASLGVAPHASAAQSSSTAGPDPVSPFATDSPSAAAPEAVSASTAAIATAAANGTPVTNPSSQVNSAEAQNAAAASSSWSSQNTLPHVSTSESSAPTALAAQNGLDVTTGGRSGGSGRFLADAGEGGTTGFGALEDGPTPSAAQAQLACPQPASVVTVPTGTLSVQPTSATSVQSTGVASVPTHVTSAETSTQSAVSMGAQVQTATPSGGASTGTASATLLACGVPMQEMIDAIHATVAMAARQGIAQARIELQPEELGQISIRLSQTSAGLSARVSADTAAGAQALTQGDSELRQSLSSLGVSLLRLDIGSSGQSQTREQGERFSGHTNGSNASTSTTTANENEGLGESSGETRPLGVARGEIVDVLA
jgi:flagellar hook-length control protein FliK